MVTDEQRRRFAIDGDVVGHHTRHTASPDSRRVPSRRLAAIGQAARWTDTFLDAVAECPAVHDVAPNGASVASRR